MKLTLIVAEAATSPNGTVNMLGGFWTFVSNPQLTALAILVEFEPDEVLPDSLSFDLSLLTDEGYPVTQFGTPVAIKGQGGISTSEIPEAKGLPQRSTITLTIPPLEIASGHYRWHINVNDGLGVADYAFGVNRATVAP